MLGVILEKPRVASSDPWVTRVLCGPPVFLTLLLPSLIQGSFAHTIESHLYLTCWDCGLKLAFQAEGLGRCAGWEAHMRCLQMDWLCTKPPHRQTGNSWYHRGVVTRAMVNWSL